MKLKHLYTKIIPNSLKKILVNVNKTLKSFILFLRHFHQKKIYRKSIKRISIKYINRVNINVVFIVFDDAIWKYKTLYQLFENHEIFTPYIVIAKIRKYNQHYDDITSEKKFEEVLNFFSKDYRVYGGQSTSYNIQKTFKYNLNPEIIINSVPYNYFDYEFTIENQLDKLTIYAGYAFNATNYKGSVKNKNNYLVWRYYIESNYHYTLYSKWFRFSPKNFKVSGFIGNEVFKYNNFKVLLKINDRKPVKKIIWAPHWTIKNNSPIKLSNFLIYSESILLLAKKYINEIEIVLKPHPLLKDNLSLPDMWGPIQTNKYFKQWTEGKNTSIQNGNYVDLFNDSDAIIHDSGSFIVEYLLTGNMAAYFVNNETFSELNEYGKMALENYYLIKDFDQLECFIINVIKENDPMKIKRENFYNEKLKISYNSPSKYIFNDLLKSLSQN